MQCFDEAVVLLDDTQVAWLISTQENYFGAY
jgi:hypothetical protein